MITDETLRITLSDLNSRLNMIFQRFEEVAPQDFQIYTRQLEDILFKIKDGFIKDTYFVCSGEFSAGKSTFVNAIINDELLPTANRPCTSLITEVRFAESCGMYAKIVYLDGAVEDITYDDYKVLVDGATKKIGTVAAIHHVELYYDISNSQDESPLLKTLKNLNIILVDTPGFGSPYPINEDIIKEYIDMSAFGFWFFPVDRFGGVTCKNVLRRINAEGKKIRVVPILTKADLLTSAQEMEEVAENFRNNLGEYFAKNDPLFISGYALRDAIKTRTLAEKEHDEAKRAELLAHAEQLDYKSGIGHIAMELSTKTQSRVFTSIKMVELSSTVKEFLSIAKDPISKIRVKNNNLLADLGWKENNEYARVDEIRKKLGKWAISEGKDLSESFKNELAADLHEIINTSFKTVTIEREFAKLLSDKTEVLKNKILKTSIPIILKEFSIKDEQINMPSFDGIKRGRQFVLPKDILAENINVLFKTIQESGIKATTQAGFGATILASTPALAQIPIAGAAFATLAPILGGAFILIALCSILPAFSEVKKHSKEKNFQSIVNSIEVWVQKTKFDSLISSVILSIIEEAHMIAKGAICPLMSDAVCTRECILKIDNDIAYVEDKVKTVLPLYSKTSRVR